MTDPDEISLGNYLESNPYRRPRSEQPLFETLIYHHPAKDQVRMLTEKEIASCLNEREEDSGGDSTTRKPPQKNRPTKRSSGS